MDYHLVEELPAYLPQTSTALLAAPSIPQTLTRIWRFYLEFELKGLSRDQLLKLARRPRLDWHGKTSKFTKLNKTRLRTLLLDPSNHFTTDSPPPAPQNDTPNALSSSSNPASQYQFAFQLPVYVDSSLQQTHLPTNNVMEPHHESLKFLLLSIEDIRAAPLGTHPPIVSLLLKVHVASTGCPIAGDWIVSAAEVVRKLQESNRAICGSETVKLGVPDLQYPRNMCYFVNSTPAALPAAELIPNFFTIPASSTLTIRVDHGTTAAPIPSKHKHKDNALDYYPYDNSLHTLNPNPNLVTHDRKGRALAVEVQQAHLEDVSILYEIARSLPGYDTFKRSHNRILSNPNIPSYWAFAARFSSTHYKTISKTTGCTIHESVICAALGVKSTWLLQAKKGDRLVRKFGEGGMHRAQEVIDEIARVDTPPLGSGRLLKFLKNWEIKHAVFAGAA